MDQSKKAKALKAKYKDIARRNQWFRKLIDYLRRLKCCGRQTTVKGDIIPSIVGDHPMFLGSQMTENVSVIPSVIGDHTVDDIPPDLVDITCGLALAKEDENRYHLDQGPKFNPLTLKDLATEVYLKSYPKRRRRRHNFFQAPYCGQTCAHHDNYFPVQTEKLRQEIQAPYYIV